MSEQAHDALPDILRRATEGIAADEAAARAAAETDQMVQAAEEVLPYLFSMTENFILAVAQHTRGGRATGYAEFCLRNKLAEALTEYALQVNTDKTTDAAALVRTLSVLKDAKAGHATEG